MKNIKILLAGVCLSAYILPNNASCMNALVKYYNENKSKLASGGESLKIEDADAVERRAALNFSQELQKIPGNTPEKITAFAKEKNLNQEKGVHAELRRAVGGEYKRGNCEDQTFELSVKAGEVHKAIKEAYSQVQQKISEGNNSQKNEAILQGLDKKMEEARKYLENVSSQKAELDIRVLTAEQEAVESKKKADAADKYIPEYKDALESSLKGFNNNISDIKTKVEKGVEKIDEEREKAKTAYNNLEKDVRASITGLCGLTTDEISALSSDDIKNSTPEDETTAKILKEMGSAIDTIDENTVSAKDVKTACQTAFLNAVKGILNQGLSLLEKPGNQYTVTPDLPTVDDVKNFVKSNIDEEGTNKKIKELETIIGK